MNPHLKHLIDLSLILWLDNRNVLKRLKISSINFHVNDF